jgi:membrane-associated phospholipid phosphatase
VDRAILIWIHQHATPTLDTLFRASNELGTLPFCATLVVAAIVWHLVRGERRAAAAWVIVGLATLLLTESLKLSVGRPRPALWAHLVAASGFAFPSGHAVASAALFPLLGWVALRARRRWRALGYALGLGVAAYVGIGRLYLGVHWPSDVLAGWVLGVALSGAAVWWLGRTGKAA